MCFTHTFLPTSTFFFVLADLHRQSFSLAFSVRAKEQGRAGVSTHVASRHLFGGQAHAFRQLPGDLNPPRTGRNGAGDGGEGGYADEALLKCEAVLRSPDATCLFVCDGEEVHVRMSQTYMSVACDGEAVKAAEAASEFSHVASLGEQGKTSRHRRSQAIFRPPLPPAGKWGRVAT